MSAPSELLSMIPPDFQLLAFREIYCLVISVIIATRLPLDYRYLKREDASWELPLLFGVVQLPRLSPLATLAVGMALVSFTLWGGSRDSSGLVLFVAAFLAVLYFAQIIGLPSVRRKANTIPVVLFVLGVVFFASAEVEPWVAFLGVTTVKLVVAQVYFSSGLAKLRTSGWQWTDGKTVQAWLLYYHMRYGSLVNLRLASSISLCRFLSLALLGFELTFWLVIPFPVLEWVFVPAGVLFHAATAWFMKIHYWVHLGPIYLIFAAPLWADVGFRILG